MIKLLQQCWSESDNCLRDKLITYYSVFWRFKFRISFKNMNYLAHFKESLYSMIQQIYLSGFSFYNDWAILLILDDALVLGNKDQVNICA